MTSISFCICTGGNNDVSIQQIVDSIIALAIPIYEIIIVGGETTSIPLNGLVKHIPFDESSKADKIVCGEPGRWVTRKKNAAARMAQHEICVIFNDYIVFDPNWWIEFQKFGIHWDICVHQCLVYRGFRGDGWRIDKYPGLPRCCMVPYDMYDLSPYMAIQGNYVVIKRQHFLTDPFDEERLWGEEEDMEWSRRIVPKSRIVCNPNCIVRYNKDRGYTDDRHEQIDIPQMVDHAWLFNSLRDCRIENYKVAQEPKGRIWKK
jgi:hypothetical protein